METEFSSIQGIISAIFIGFIIGLRHSMDGDHVVAVATMARDYKSVFKGLWVGGSWGLGHSTPLLLLGCAVLLVKQSALEAFASVATYFEFGVAIMLVFLGIQVFWKMYRGDFHVHGHEHGTGEHKHLHGTHEHNEEAEPPHEEKKHGLFPELIPFFRLKSYAIGVVHGLAGSAAVLLLILPSTESLLSGITFLLFFALGTMISMAVMTIVLSLPFAISSRSHTVGNVIISFAGLTSIGLGAALGSDLTVGTNFTGFLWY